MSEEIVSNGPVILHQGKYRLYGKPDGTLRVQYQRDDKDAEDFFEIPGTMVRIAEGMATGTMSIPQMMAEVTKLISEMKRRQ